MTIVLIAISTLIGLYSLRWVHGYAEAINNGHTVNSKTLCISLLQVKHKDFILLRDTLCAFGFAVINASLILIKADIFLLLMCNVLLLLAIIDYFTGLLPDALTMPLMLLAWIFSPLGLIAASSSSALVFAMLYLASSLYFLLRKRHGFGGGDIKLMAAIAAWFGIDASLNILFMACVLALFFILIVGFNLKQIFVFGPFIAIATIVQMLI